MIDEVVPSLDADDGAITPHARQSYLPLTYSERQALGKKALCLSGGGFRSALFHLGALRRLNELGVLSQFDTIVSVSGGSILSAHLARRITEWPEAGTRITGHDWETRVADPFRKLTRRNLRTWPLLKGYLLPNRWFRNGTAVDALAERYQRRLTDQMLHALPQRPEYLFCTTELVSGLPLIFSSTASGKGTAWLDTGQVVLTLSLPPKWTVARAVAASSAFPPFFDALAVPVRKPVGWPPDDHSIDSLLSDGSTGRLRLTDGGVYDNMGLEPVWKNHVAAFVSDGGATFDPEQDQGLLWRLRRYPAVQGAQVTAVRKRWLIARYTTTDDRFKLDGAYWGIGSAAEHYDNKGQSFAGYSADLVDDVICEIRTDMDAFSHTEIAVLENHGYFLANAAITQHTPELIRYHVDPVAPHPRWFPNTRNRLSLENEIRRALRQSSKRVPVVGRYW